MTFVTRAKCQKTKNASSNHSNKSNRHNKSNTNNNNRTKQKNNNGNKKNKLILANVYFWPRGLPGLCLSFISLLASLLGKFGHTPTQMVDRERERTRRRRSSETAKLRWGRKKATNLVIMATRVTSVDASLHVCVCGCAVCAWAYFSVAPGRGHTHLLRSV